MLYGMLQRPCCRRDSASVHQSQIKLLTVSAASVQARVHWIWQEEVAETVGILVHLAHGTPELNNTAKSRNVEVLA